jgi:dTDP-4-dehydrorhamnose reductase
MSIQKILVTGANGQLGWELSQLASAYPNYELVMADRSLLDLSKPETIITVLDSISPDAIINPAAYTGVDKAETEKELAYTINAKSVEVMAAYAAAKHIPFISYSTDYVFTGDATSPYTTDTAIAPLNFYGSTKADGESLAFAANPNTIIIRTSWVFSSHGNNFVKTMMRFMKERDSLNIVADQKGRPTYARDLAIVTMKMIEAIDAGKVIKGVYHFANQGETTWYDFAKKIQSVAGLTCEVNPTKTIDFPTPAKRPAYSVLDTSRIEKELDIKIPHWETALKACYDQIMNAS